MTWQAVATITAGILSSVVLLGGAVSAAARLWRYRAFRVMVSPVAWTVATLWVAYDASRDARFAAKVDEAIGRLFRPNGGASLHDLSQRITEIERTLGIRNRHTDPDGEDP